MIPISPVSKVLRMLASVLQNRHCYYKQSMEVNFVWHSLVDQRCPAIFGKHTCLEFHHT